MSSSFYTTPLRQPSLLTGTDLFGSQGCPRLRWPTSDCGNVSEPVEKRCTGAPSEGMDEVPRRVCSGGVLPEGVDGTGVRVGNGDVRDRESETTPNRMDCILSK